MYNKVLHLISLTAFVLSACGGQTAQVTEMSTAVPAATTGPPIDTPATTDTPSAGDTLTPEPTATGIPPDNATDCLNKAAFVGDVTIPDNTNITAGAAFTKTWRVQNAGTCIWWSGYTLSHYSEVSMSAPESVPLPRTNAGETADISVNLIAPGAVGTHRSNFVIKNPAGLIMQVDNDSRLWLIINVISVTSTDAGTGDGSGDANINCVTATDAPRTDQILSAINSFRTQNNLAKYTVNAQLALAAQAHANDMACNQLSEHEGSEGSDGSTPQTRVAAAGYAGTDDSTAKRLFCRKNVS